MLDQNARRPMAVTSLDRRGFGSLLASAAGAACLAPWPAGAATDDPPRALRTVSVRTTQQLGFALANAIAGDHIVLGSGTWSGNWTLASNGNPQNPIVIEAATRHGTTMTGTITLAGAFSGVYGLRFSGNSLGVQIGADDTFVLRCWFLGPRGVKATSQKRVRIGYNRFTGGPVRDLGGGHHVYFDIPLTSDTSRLPEGGRIYRNAFASLSGSGADGEYMHIYIGDTGGRDNTPSLTDFEITHNRIFDSIRRRGIYTKRGGTVMYNHVIGSGPGVTGIRHGGNGRFSGNRIDNINSVIINGPGHRVEGNWVRAKLGLRLECEYVAESGTFYNAAHNALLVGNNADVTTVGYIQDGATLVQRVSGVRIYNHTGSVILGNETGTQVFPGLPPEPGPYPTPVTLGLNSVGPDAP